MDGPTALLLIFAGPAIFLLGGWLAIAPRRATAALHEWYVVPPEVSAERWLALLLVRVVGMGLVVLAVWLELQILGLMSALGS
jgi:hypothetical protein